MPRPRTTSTLSMSRLRGQKRRCDDEGDGEQIEDQNAIAEPLRLRRIGRVVVAQTLLEDCGSGLRVSFRHGHRRDISLSAFHRAREPEGREDQVTTKTQFVHSGYGAVACRLPAATA